MSESVIVVENLVKRYKELIALDHFNLDIKQGEIFGLLGPNGSGKTTTINCILALLNYDKGSIKVFGEDMKPDSYEQKSKIGVVMQNVAVFDAFYRKNPCDGGYAIFAGLEQVIDYIENLNYYMRL